MFWQMAVGSTVSSIVTAAVQLSVLPLGSVAVRVTVFAPAFEQLNESGVAVRTTEQLSFEPLSTSFAVIVAFPVASS